MVGLDTEKNWSDLEERFDPSILFHLFKPMGIQPSLQVCNPAYLVPVQSQDKFGRVAAGRTFGLKLGR